MTVPTAAQTTRRPRPLTIVVAGLLLLQIAWVFSIRPFAGIDEFAHFDRAVGVSLGQWAPSPTQAVHGSGTWVIIPTADVQATTSECEALPYTASAECRGKAVSAGTTRVATSAGRYNPLFYALVGYPTRGLPATAALVAMRLIDVVVCWLMLLLALSCTQRWARGPWPAAAVLLCFTPTVLYSSALAAPNALEICAGIVLWTALLGVLAPSTRARPDPLLLAAATGSACLLVTLRSLGPGWFLLICLGALLASPRPLERLRSLSRHRGVRRASVLVALASGASVAWILLMKATVLSSDGVAHLSAGTKASAIASELVLWPLQSVAAFPYRNQATSPVVYACYLVLGLGLLGLGWAAGPRLRRIRWAIAFVAVLSLLLPAISTWLTIDEYGTAWQGRYTLPFATGVLILAGYALDRSDVAWTWRTALPGVALFVVAHGISVLHTFLEQYEKRPPTAPVWATIAPPLVGVSLCVGLGLLATGGWLLARPPVRPPSGAADAPADRAETARVGPA